MLAMLTGCGLKGPLYLPQETEEAPIAAQPVKKPSKPQVSPETQPSNSPAAEESGYQNNPYPADGSYNQQSPTP